LTEAKDGAGPDGEGEGMSRLLILAGIVLMGVIGLSTLAAVVTGAVQWVGLAAPAAGWPPQSLVVGGLFLGIPLIALGWGLVWFGRWLATHGPR
jgi:hypothetical protein